jgi:hypothetical protein
MKTIPFQAHRLQLQYYNHAPMPNTPLSQALATLADAIDQLAFLVADQRSHDNTEQVRQFSVIVQKFKQVSQAAGTNADQKHDWNAKYKKGYLKKWLKTKNLVPAQAQESLKADIYLNNAAEYLATNFSQLAEFYQRLKYGQSLKRNFTYATNSNAMKYIVQWCKMLHKQNFIDQVVEKQTEVYVDIAEMAEATLFINGFWLELVLRSQVAKLIKGNFENIQSFDILSQLHLLKPDNKMTELDLLIMINDKVYWFECKTGDIGSYYKTFATHRQLLGLDYAQAAVLIPAANIQMTANFRVKSGMQTLNVSDLETQLHEIIFK